jgi:7-cyano-7-deazaguanine reductase
VNGPTAPQWRRARLYGTLRANSIFHAMPQPELLEAFPNPYPGRAYEIQLSCPEFTSLCPVGGIESDASELAMLKGGAPDFGTMVIMYSPAELCVELKSLKLYLWSFRNDGVFYERAVNRILDDLVAKVAPRWMEVVGDFNVRGGIKSVVKAGFRIRDRASGLGVRGS